MRGADEQPGATFSDASLENRVPADHPLCAIRRITDQALEQLSPRFGALYVNLEDRRFRRRSCCGRCCSRHSTRPEANGR